MIVIAIAVTIIMMANRIMRMTPGVTPPSSPPANAPTMPAAPIKAPLFQRTRPDFAWLNMLTALVAPG